MVIQLTVLTAVHEQDVPVMTDSPLVDPVDGTDTVVAETVGVAHCADAGRASRASSRTTRKAQYRMAFWKRSDSCISWALKNRGTPGCLGEC